MFRGIKHMLWERRAEALFKELFERFPLPLAGKVLYSHTPQRGQKAYTFFDDDGSYRVVIDLEEQAVQQAEAGYGLVSFLAYGNRRPCVCQKPGSDCRQAGV